ncbi:MAG: hypothetical protein JO340_01470 [Acidobacteriaceae bacterium]|nr:hypothetical protein [Acidobacteriaceae bacterium]
MANLTKTTQDHNEIRSWAEERGGKPSHVKRTGSGEDVGILRIDFPGFSGEDSLEPITWEQWFEKFDERGLALLYEEETAAGQRSNFNKIVTAETARKAESKSGGRASSRKRPSKTAGKKAAAPKKTAASKKSGASSKKTVNRGAKKAAPARNAGKKTASKKGTPKKAAKTSAKSARKPTKSASTNKRR